MARSKSIVLIGLMGAGKTSIGRRLAACLGRRFTDVDEEIVKAAGMSVEDIFAAYGEKAFRDVEERVVARLLDDTAQVVATGGGAFINPATRERIRSKAVSVWLRADLDILVERTSRRGGRPLLKDKDPREVLAELMEQRHPTYSEADVVVDSSTDPPDATVQKVLEALAPYIDSAADGGRGAR